MNLHVEPFTGKAWQIAILDSERLGRPARFRTVEGGISMWNTGDSHGTLIHPYIRSNGRNMVNPDWLDAPYEWATMKEGLAITQQKTEHGRHERT